MEADLISMGLRLRDAGDPDFNLRDLCIVIKHLPPESRLVKAIKASLDPDPKPDDGASEWGIVEHLLAIIADCLRWLVWAKSKASRRPGAQPPDPIPRPGVEPPDKKHKPAKATPLDKARDRFRVKRTQQKKK